MTPSLSPARRGAIVAALGTSLTVSWASGYYIPAVLAVPMAEDPGLSPVWVFGVFSVAMVVSALAAHLPGLLQAAGASTAVAIAAGALIGPAQVARGCWSSGFCAGSIR